MEFSLLHKNCKPWNKIEVAILNFDDVVTFNSTLVAHLIFQIRKVLVTKNSNQTTRCSLPGAWTAVHKTMLVWDLQQPFLFRPYSRVVY